MRIGIYPFMQTEGNHKAFFTPEIVEDATINEINTISVISSGNYVDAIRRELKRKRSKIQLVNLVNDPGTLNTAENGYLEVVIKDNRILRNQVEREDYVRANFPNAGKVKDYTDFESKAYPGVAYMAVSSSYFFTPLVDTGERENSGYDIPLHSDYISVGVGSGKFFLDLATMIQRFKAPTKLIGVIPIGENGIFNDSDLVVREGLLYRKSKFDPRNNASKLSCPYTSFKPRLLASMKEGHMFYEASNEDFERAFNLGRKVDLVGEVSSTAGLVLHDPQVRKRLGLPKKGNLLAVVSCGARGERYKTIFEN